jgi:predicted metal-dependent RNase
VRQGKLEVSSRVKIYGEAYERRAEVVTIRGGFSAHRGKQFLVEYAQAVEGQVKEVFLVNGEAGQARALKEVLAEVGMGDVAYPEMHSGVEF